MSADIPLGLYIHFPWCIKKCPYCDFNSHTIKNGIPEHQYINALLTDLQHDVQRFNEIRQISHIFIGGGTPSLFSPETIARLLQSIRKIIPFRENLETTLEANPGTFESGKFAEFRSAGINRLSIGIQSFNDRHLHHLGRVHSAKEAIRASEIALKTGFDNFNLDLMYGLPGQTFEHSEQDIKTAINLKPTHISYYQLTLEPNTYFYKHPPTLPADEAIFVTQTNSQQILADCDYHQYEISAYTKPGHSCRHNLNYWKFGDYLGIGAGAHGKITHSLPGQILRYWKTKSPDQYLLNSVHKQSLASEQSISVSELPLEFMMNQLRLKKGFTIAAYTARTGLPAKTLEPALTQCLEEQFIVNRNGRFCCSVNGWNFLDSILEKFIF